LFATLQVFIGSIVTAYIFGNLAALMSTIDKKENLLNDQLDLVQQTMKSIKLPDLIQDDVMSYFQYINETPDVNSGIDKFFNLVGPKLKQLILFHLHSEVIKSISIFKGLSEIEVNFIVFNLQNEIYMPAEIICNQGEEAKDMFFITKGKVEVQISRHILDEEHLVKFTKKRLNK
jgi:hypothetical protein